MKDFFSIGFVLKYLNGHPLAEGATIAIIVACVVAIIASAYLLGSLNFAIIISGKQYRQDIRNFGSKNAGMTNMMRIYGKKAAGLTLLGDALKAAVSALIGYALLGQYGAYIAGLFCIVGHMFPVYYRFRGGKGVVTAAVSILMSNPFVFLILFLIFVIIVLFTKYISLGSVMCALTTPVTMVLFYPGHWVALVLMTLTAALVVWAHRGNISRLLKGTESKFSFKKE